MRSKERRLEERDWILAEHEREELQSTSGENSEQLTINAEETLPAVVEVATQTQNMGKNVSVQF